jgi:hypothetical protein
MTRFAMPVKVLKTEGTKALSLPPVIYRCWKILRAVSRGCIPRNGKAYGCLWWSGPLLGRKSVVARSKCVHLTNFFFFKSCLIFVLELDFTRDSRCCIIIAPALLSFDLGSSSFAQLPRLLLPSFARYRRVYSVHPSTSFHRVCLGLRSNRIESNF